MPSHLVQQMARPMEEEEADDIEEQELAEADLDTICMLMRFLQLCCEGHNLSMQVSA